MSERSIRPGVVLFTVAVLAALAAFVFLIESRPAHPRKPPSESAEAGGTLAASPQAEKAAPREAGERSPRLVAPVADEPVPYVDGLVWGDLDLREARELMPDNLFWKYGVPTKDESELAAREEEKKRRNEEYGRVLAGDASEDEVRAYYDYRRRMASDYLEFAEFMQRQLRDSSNEQLRGLIDLGLKMNAEKLKQLNAEMEDALARSRERAEIREQWRQQQQEFGDLTPPGEETH
jgi:hypothetical protein